MTLLLALGVLTSAHAGKERWRSQPIDPRARPSGTAFTVPKNTWQIGLVSQNYGLLDNVQIGTQLLPLLVGIPGIQGKITAIRTPKLDVAVDAGITYVDLGRFSDTLGFGEDFDANVTVPRIGFRGSWIVSKRLSVHIGAAATFATATGAVGVEDLAVVVSNLAGADIEDELRDAIGDDNTLFARVRLGLPQTRLAVDIRLNRRDSIILSSNAYLALTGQLSAGADVQTQADGVGIESGLFARINAPLPETFASLTTLSWQFDWRRVNLRLGIPLNPTNPIGYVQAVDIYLMLGPARRKVRP